MLLMYLMWNMKGHPSTEQKRHLELGLVRGGTLQIRAGILWKDRMRHIFLLKICSALEDKYAWQ